MKWTIELSEFNISYKPRVAIKAHVMADFVAEFTELEVGFNWLGVVTVNDEDWVWKVSVDGSSRE